MNGRFVWYKNFGSYFCRFITIHAFDRRTDGHFGHANTALHTCSAVQIKHCSPEGVTLRLSIFSVVAYLAQHSNIWTFDITKTNPLRHTNKYCSCLKYRKKYWTTAINLRAVVIVPSISDAIFLLPVTRSSSPNVLDFALDLVSTRMWLNVFQLVLTNSNHVLSSLLSDKTNQQHYYLRARRYHRQLVDKRNKLFRGSPFQ